MVWSLINQRVKLVPFTYWVMIIIFYGYPFRRRISPVTGYVVNLGIAFLLYLFSMSQLLLRKYENIWLACATGVLLGTVLGFLKISMQANHAYQENMKTA